MAFEEGLFDKHGAVTDVETTNDDDVTVWVGLGWFCVVMLGSALVAGLSLPFLPGYQDRPTDVGDVVRFDWLIVATFLAYPIRCCCQARIWLGLLAMAAASAQSFSIVDTATERIETYHIAATATGLWWAVPVFQLICYAAFATAGVRTRLAERRWQRLTAKLMRNPSTPRPVPR